MFTGIIEAVGTITDLRQHADEWRLTIDSGSLELADVKLGDSIAVSGACLTVVKLDANGFRADVSNETMSLTNLGTLETGSAVNLEKALTASGRLGGHLVSGHVDGVGELMSLEPDGGSWRLEFKAPDALARYIAGKGSICVDGTSLTVNTVKGARFTVNIIPHTQQETVIRFYRPGTRVNLEVDLVSRYLERLLLGDAAADPQITTSNLTREFLASHGFGGRND
ncbi:MAG: riboflavin synthase [Gammaproteobacteria bacterium]|nr:riboflavin synthase [Pseudomonadales bacterium]MCP5348639.1 riboflavin synthase [Pseudomonadales bacterium]